MKERKRKEKKGSHENETEKSSSAEKKDGHVLCTVSISKFLLSFFMRNGNRASPGATPGADWPPIRGVRGGDGRCCSTLPPPLCSSTDYSPPLDCPSRPRWRRPQPSD